MNQPIHPLRREECRKGGNGEDEGVGESVMSTLILLLSITVFLPLLPLLLTLSLLPPPSPPNKLVEYSSDSNSSDNEGIAKHTKFDLPAFIRGYFINLNQEPIKQEVSRVLWAPALT